MERHMILGTDWWTDCDDAAAVRLFCRFAREGLWTAEAVILNSCMPYSAPSLDGFLRHEGVTLPIGIDREATDFGGNPPYQEMLSGLCTSALTNDGCEDAVRVYRRTLAGIPDGTGELLEIGYMQALAALLMSAPDDLSSLSGTELVGKKVRRIYMMAGNWADNGHGRENNFARNRRTSVGAAVVLSLCPVPMTFLGYEVGVTVIAHPVKDEGDPLYCAFAAHGSANGRCAWDPLLVWLAANGEPEKVGFDAVYGLASVNPETGENSFDENPGNPVRVDRYVVKTMPDTWYEEQIDRLLVRRYNDV